jgi:hypothetical protein
VRSARDCPDAAAPDDDPLLTRAAGVRAL